MKSTLRLHRRTADEPTAFTLPRCPELWYVSPPTRYLCALATGGLRNLYDDIDIRSRSTIHRCFDAVSSSKLQPYRQIMKKHTPTVSNARDAENPNVCSFAPWNGMPKLAGRYLFRGVLAHGHTAVIICAEDTFCNSTLVAIKVMHAHNYIVGGQEADILRQIHSTNSVPIVRLLNIFRTDVHYCLVFEALSSRSLLRHFDCNGWVGSNALLPIQKLAQQILQALSYIHSRNIIHADIKMDNILMCGDSSDITCFDLRLIDFGNSIRFKGDEVADYEDDYELQTLMYRSPEVMLGFSINYSLDLWSFGCLLAELYLGHPLFNGHTKHDILKQMFELMGPLPMKFQLGKFGIEFQQFCGRTLSHEDIYVRLSKHLKCSTSVFTKFLAGLLNYNPDKRLTAQAASRNVFVSQDLAV